MQRGVLRIGVDADRTVVRKRLRQEAGFGLLELLMAMTILNIGILAVVGAFNSGAVALRRAGGDLDGNRPRRQADGAL